MNSELANPLTLSQILDKSASIAGPIIDVLHNRLQLKIPTINSAIDLTDGPYKMLQTDYQSSLSNSLQPLCEEIIATKGIKKHISETDSDLLARKLARQILRPQLSSFKPLQTVNPEIWGTILGIEHYVNLATLQISKSWTEDNKILTDSTLDALGIRRDEMLMIYFPMCEGLGEIFNINYICQQLGQNLQEDGEFFTIALGKAEKFIDQFKIQVQDHLDDGKLDQARWSNFPAFLDLLKDAFNPANADGWKATIKYLAENNFPIMPLLNGNSSFALRHGKDQYDAEIKFAVVTNDLIARDSEIAPYHQIGEQLHSKLHQTDEQLAPFRNAYLLSVHGYSESQGEGEEFANMLGLIFVNNFDHSVDVDKIPTLKKFMKISPENLIKMRRFIQRYLEVHEIGHLVSHNREMDIVHIDMLSELFAESISIDIIATHSEQTGQLDRKTCRDLIRAVFVENLEVLETENPDIHDDGADYYYSEQKILLRLLRLGVVEPHLGYLNYNFFDTQNNNKEESPEDSQKRGYYYVIKNPEKGIKSLRDTWKRLWREVYDPKLENSEVEKNVVEYVNWLTRDNRDSRLDEIMGVLRKNEQTGRLQISN